MERWHEFESPVEVLAWGRNEYVVVRLPDGLVDAARRAGTRRVEGTIEAEPVNLGVNRADVVASAFVYVGPGLRARLDVSPGDVVSCRLRPADPGVVLVPGDVASALEDAGRRDAFDRLTPAQRRQRLAPIDQAKRPDTRARRIAALVAGL